MQAHYSIISNFRNPRDNDLRNACDPVRNPCDNEQTD
jgi:hypothetical protein